MADNDNQAQAYEQRTEPAPDLKKLDRLVGAWEMSGDVRGRSPVSGWKAASS